MTQHFVITVWYPNQRCDGTLGLIQNLGRDDERRLGRQINTAAEDLTLQNQILDPSEQGPIRERNDPSGDPAALLVSVPSDQLGIITNGAVRSVVTHLLSCGWNSKMRVLDEKDDS